MSTAIRETRSLPQTPLAARRSTDPGVLGLSPTDAFVLSRVDGCLSAEQILAITPLSEPDARASLFRLLDAGLIEPKAHRSALRAEAGNVLRFPARAPAPRPAPEPAPSTMETLVEVDALIGAGRLAEGAFALEGLITRTEGRARQHARLLLASAYARRPESLRRAEAVLKDALAEEPCSAEVHFALGTLYRKTGMTARAAALFKATLGLDPHHAGAAQELAKLQPPAKAPAERLLARFRAARG